MQYPSLETPLSALLESARQKHLIFSYRREAGCVTLLLDSGAESFSPEQAYTFLQAVLAASGSYRLN